MWLGVKWTNPKKLMAHIEGIIFCLIYYTRISCSHYSRWSWCDWNFNKIGAKWMGLNEWTQHFNFFLFLFILISFFLYPTVFVLLLHTTASHGVAELPIEAMGLGFKWTHPKIFFYPMKWYSFFLLKPISVDIVTVCIARVIACLNFK